MQTPHAPPQTRLSVGLPTIKPLRGMGRGRRAGSEEKMEEQRDSEKVGERKGIREGERGGGIIRGDVCGS